MSYVTRRPKPRAAYDDWYGTEGPSQITVHEPDDEAEYTGLVDIHGNGLYRTRDRIAMGYRGKCS